MVSRACSSGESSGPTRGRDAALRVAGVALARIGLGEHDARRRPSASEIAARSPAMPLPIDQEIGAQRARLLSYQSDACTTPHAMTASDAAVERSTIRVDVTPVSARPPSWSATGSASSSRALLDAHGVGAQALRRLEPGDLAPSRARASSRPLAGRAHPAARRRALQDAGDRCRAIYDALIRGGADRGSAHRGRRRRRHRRYRRIRGRQLPARHHARARADDAAGAGGQLHRRQGRRQPRARQEPDRRVPSARARASPIRSCSRTLPRREFRSGPLRGGQVRRDRQPRRCSIGWSRDTKAVFARTPAVLVPAIVESCRIKADVVSKDEREGGLRRILNFGHTIGHALEAITNYRRFRHGEAIALRHAGRRRSRRGPRRAGRSATVRPSRI